MSPIAALLTVCALANAVLAQDSCTVTSYDQVANALSICTTLSIGDITVPANETLDLNLKSGASLSLTGTIKFGFAEWKGPLVIIKGNKVTVTQSASKYILFGGGGVIRATKNLADSVFDGEGAQYWDGQGDKGKVKPKFVRVQTTGGSVLNGINLLNCPHQCVSINGADSTTLQNWTLDVSAGDEGDLGHNTDGFDISSSTNIIIDTATVKNQDDCVAVNQGSNIHLTGLTCSGGHGLSLSVGQNSGSDNTVSNVTFVDSSVSNSRNGIHVKTHTDGGTGFIKNVTYRNIQMTGITRFIINIQEDYAGGGSTGIPKNNIPITGLDISEITATTSGSDCVPVFILCATDGGCSDWTWGQISYSGASNPNNCTNFTPSGFDCS
ncbi:polygalacturonase-like [Cylas formicarius]|uniref:polygalacturonase-like n=1 Tax=Cylas formicarius TaxID=197179 RepID=UPI0029584AE0|nr:polygalacturonase-like [Cylas formicarius]